MPKDYAKQFNKKGKSKKPNVLNWLLPVLLFVIIIGGLVFWKHHLQKKLPPVEKAKVAWTKTVDTNSDAGTASDETNNKPHFEFYTMLPKMQVGNDAATATSSSSSAVNPATDTNTKKAVPVESAQPTTINPASNNTVSVAAKERYILQLGVFRDKAAAEEYKNRLVSLGSELRVEKFRTNEGDRYRVQAGPFDDVDIAKQLQAKLAKSKVHSILKRS